MRLPILPRAGRAAPGVTVTDRVSLRPTAWGIWGVWTAWGVWGIVGVDGRSMLPTLAPGDACLVRWGARPHPGDVVVARLPARPLGIKRVRWHDAAGWWLASDNPREGADSATFGQVDDGDVLGRVVLRYWPRPRLVRRLRS